MSTINGSNYLDPGVASYDFFGTSIRDSVIWPRLRSPLTDQFARIDGIQRNLREALNNDNLRLMLTGTRPSPNRTGTPILADELPSHIEQAVKQRLLTPEVLSADLRHEQTRMGQGFTRFYNAIWKFEAVDLEEAFNKVEFSEPNRDRLLQVALYRLGCMLALTHQIVFEADALGYPLDRNYRPTDKDLHRAWEKAMGGELPNISQLYHRGHKVLTANANINDPNLTYLFDLAVDVLPWKK